MRCSPRLARVGANSWQGAEGVGSVSMVWSVRRVADRQLRRARRSARRNGASRPPWPTAPGRLAGSVWRWHQSAAGLLVGLVAWVGALIVVGLARPRSFGISAATSSFLAVLWQVQAASVGFVFALAVFVFGLLPQTRGRVTYREFLARSWTLRLVVFNVGSLLFTGLVLLGAGHQVRPAGNSPGYGWSITVASAVSLAAVASILILLGRTITAIDPAAGRRARNRYAHKALGRALRSELREIACLKVTLGPPGLGIGYGGAGAGIDVSAGGGAARRVRDVALWALKLLKWHAKRRGLMEPALRVWPGRTVTPSSALITIGSGSGPVARWWARRCVRLGRVPSDSLATALEAMHAEVMDHIRAGRPVEATESIQALADLLVPVWQGYAAYGQAYEQEPVGWFWIQGPTVAARIMRMLDAELRAAAVSSDEQICRTSTTVPRQIAVSALRHKAAGSIRDGLALLLSVYDAVVGDLTDGGRQPLPATGLARRRTGAPFQAVLSFTLGQLQMEIDRAVPWTAGAGLSADAADLAATRFAAAQIGAAHHVLLFMLRRAIQVRDTTTLKEVLPQWHMPDTSRVQHALEAASARRNETSLTGNSPEPPGGSTWQEELAQSLDRARNELAVMLFRLFADALHTDRMQGPAAEPDEAVVSICGLLPATEPWQVLGTALQAAQQDWFRPPRDEEIAPTGVVVTGFSNPVPAMLDTFVVAAMMRPELSTGEPDPATALARAEALRGAVDRVLAQEKPLLQRYGVPPETADQRGAALRDQITRAERAARRQQEDEILARPVSSAAKDLLQAIAREEFRDTDITGRILTWAGHPPSRATSEDSRGDLAAVSMTAPKAIFLDENDGNIPEVGARLGHALADNLIGQLLAAAGTEGLATAINQAQGSASVRAAIADLRTYNAPDQNGRPSPAARIIALIAAAQPSETKEHFGITETAAETWLRGKHPGVESSRDRMLRELGLPDRRAWQLYGLIDDTPVLQIRMPQGRLVLLDLARFAQIQLPPESSGAGGDAVIELAEPGEAGTRAGLVRPTVDEGTDTPTQAGTEDAERTEDRLREEMLKVKIKFGLPGRLHVCDVTAARIFTWEQRPPQLWDRVRVCVTATRSIPSSPSSARIGQGALFASSR